MTVKRRKKFKFLYFSVSMEKFEKWVMKNFSALPARETFALSARYAKTKARNLIAHNYKVFLVLKNSSSFLLFFKFLHSTRYDSTTHHQLGIASFFNFYETREIRFGSFWLVGKEGKNLTIFSVKLPFSWAFSPRYDFKFKHGREKNQKSIEFFFYAVIGSRLRQHDTKRELINYYSITINRQLWSSFNWNFHQTYVTDDEKKRSNFYTNTREKVKILENFCRLRQWKNNGNFSTNNFDCTFG